MSDRIYFVYILGSLSRRLYTGITGNLVRRIYEHRLGVVEGHTRAYRITRLLYFETTSNVHAAIAREKQIKSWRRDKRVRLIERHNPDWRDLAMDWFGPMPLHEPQSQRE